MKSKKDGEGRKRSSTFIATMPPEHPSDDSDSNKIAAIYNTPNILFFSIFQLQIVSS
jgi:hypothetical protein